jgi:hypothetical protein
VKRGKLNLSPETVRRIRAEYAAGQTQRAIAVRYGMDRSNVSCIVRFRTYRSPSAWRWESSWCKLTEADIAVIRDAYRAGTKQYVLALRFGVAQSRISEIVRGRSPQWFRGIHGSDAALDATRCRMDEEGRVAKP